MRHKHSADNKKQTESRTEHRVTSVARGALSMREVYPPEEFAGFDIFGESPEWHPGQAGCDVDIASSAEVEIIVD